MWNYLDISISWAGDKVPIHIINCNAVHCSIVQRETLEKSMLTNVKDTWLSQGQYDGAEDAGN